MASSIETVGFDLSMADIDTGMRLGRTKTDE